MHRCRDIAALLLLGWVLSGCAVSPTYTPDLRSAETVAICHKNKQTLLLPEHSSALTAHLNHGDRFGACA